MKVFGKNENSYESVVNFVDDNGVFVGYDTSQHCCENAGWFISEKITTYSYDLPDNPNYDLSEYFFDRHFFASIDSGELDEGGMVVFRLYRDKYPDLFLHLYNAHNGYYGHGFEVKHSGQVVKEGYL